VGKTGPDVYTQMKIMDFGCLVKDAFGYSVYQVGSSLHRKDFNDIDIVVMLPDEVYREEYGDPEHAPLKPKWRAICRAWMALGFDIIGLPVDFKIQSQDHANQHHDGNRSHISLDYRSIEKERNK